MGIPWKGLKFSGVQVKKDTINHLAIAIEQQQLALLDDPDLFHELKMFKYSRSQSGNLKMAAEGRNHDDRVVSLALAFSELEAHGQLPNVDYLKDEAQQMLSGHGELLRVGGFAVHANTTMQALDELGSINAYLSRL